MKRKQDIIDNGNKQENSNEKGKMSFHFGAV